MPRELSPTAAQQASSPNREQVWIVLATIEHADLLAPVRLANHHEDLVSNGDTYTASSMVAGLPDEDPDKSQDSKIRVTDVSLSILGKLLGIKSIDRFVISVGVVLLSSPDTIEAGPFELGVTHIGATGGTIDITLGAPNIAQYSFSGFTFLPSTFPAIF